MKEGLSLKFKKYLFVYSKCSTFAAKTIIYKPYKNENYE